MSRLKLPGVTVTAGYEEYIPDRRVAALKDVLRRIMVEAVESSKPFIVINDLIKEYEETFDDIIFPDTRIDPVA